MNEIQILKDMLSEMGQIINAIPGQAYTSRDADTLLVMQRRLAESDLKIWLSKYNSIFAKQEKVTLEDITLSSIAYVRIKVLIEAGLTSFDAKSLRELIKECHLYMDRTTNIIRLSKTHVMAADSYQKEKIQVAIDKNEAFIQALEETIGDIEKQIERIPKAALDDASDDTKKGSLDDGFIEDGAIGDGSIDETDSKLEKHSFSGKDSAGNRLKQPGFLDRISKLLSQRKDQQEIDARLKNAEKESADTRCLEIPYYDRTLVATEILPCRDFSCYTLLKRKDNVYFGFSKNLKGNSYDNADQSLIELTEITEEFLQFMTTDILSEEYELRPFTMAEKEGMQIYFNFVSKCFEKQIGITLTVAEYLSFQAYYNRLVSKVMELEEQRKHDYYRALPIAEQYMVLMDFYNMVQSENKQQIVEAIISEKTDLYLETMELIMSHHIVDEGARAEIELLMERMKYFAEEGHFTSDGEKAGKEGPGGKCSGDTSLQNAGAWNDSGFVPSAVQQVPLGFYPQVPIIQAGVMPVMGNMYFTLQCLNEDREIIDEANFSTGNMSLAMQDYNSRDAYIKRFGLVQDGKFLPLMTSEKGEN